MVVELEESELHVWSMSSTRPGSRGSGEAHRRRHAHAAAEAARKALAAAAAARKRLILIMPKRSSGEAEAARKAHALAVSRQIDPEPDPVSALGGADDATGARRFLSGGNYAGGFGNLPGGGSPAAGMMARPVPNQPVAPGNQFRPAPGAFSGGLPQSSLQSPNEVLAPNGFPGLQGAAGNADPGNQFRPGPGVFIDVSHQTGPQSPYGGVQAPNGISSLRVGVGNADPGNQFRPGSGTPQTALQSPYGGPVPNGLPSLQGGQPPASAVPGSPVGGAFPNGIAPGLGGAADTRFSRLPEQPSGSASTINLGIGLRNQFPSAPGAPQTALQSPNGGPVPNGLPSLQVGVGNTIPGSPVRGAFQNGIAPGLGGAADNGFGRLPEQPTGSAATINLGIGLRNDPASLPSPVTNGDPGNRVNVEVRHDLRNPIGASMEIAGGAGGNHLVSLTTTNGLEDHLNWATSNRPGVSFGGGAGGGFGSPVDASIANRLSEVASNGLDNRVDGATNNQPIGFFGGTANGPGGFGNPVVAPTSNQLGGFFGGAPNGLGRFRGPVVASTSNQLDQVANKGVGGVTGDTEQSDLRGIVSSATDKLGGLLGQAWKEKLDEKDREERFNLTEKLKRVVEEAERTVLERKRQAAKDALYSRLLHIRTNDALGKFGEAANNALGLLYGVANQALGSFSGAAKYALGSFGGAGKHALGRFGGAGLHALGGFVGATKQALGTIFG